MAKVKTEIFRIARPITDTRNKYEWFAKTYNLRNYKVITSGELLVRGKYLEIPTYVKEFVRNNNEVLLIANMIEDEVSGFILRGIEEKSFVNYGLGRGIFYGIGDLDKDFKYGDLLVLVEGTIDRDVCSTFITKNCLSILTSAVTKNQAKVIRYLTNKVLLILDNDEAGNKGTQLTKKKLNQLGINVKIINKSNKVKDLGDVAEMLMHKNNNARQIIDTYRAQVLINGGKLV